MPVGQAVQIGRDGSQGREFTQGRDARRSPLGGRMEELRVEL